MNYDTPKERLAATVANVLHCPVDRAAVTALGGSLYQKFRCLNRTSSGSAGPQHVFYMTGTQLRRIARDNGIAR